MKRMNSNGRVLLVAYDNDSYISWFPQGLAYIASVLRKAGYDVTIYNQDVYHWPATHLKDYLDHNSFDVVGVGIIAGYYQYRKLLEISKAINSAKNRPFYILGGHGPSPEPEYFLKKTKANLVVRGEGERTILEVIKALGGKKDFSDIQGIAYQQNDKCIVNTQRSLIENIDEIEFPAWDLFPMDYYSLTRIPNIRSSDRCLPVLSGRGCTFSCNFCYRMDKGFRPRSAKSILEEIERLKKDYSITAVDFSDELLMSSEQRTILLCESFIKSGIKFKWSCNGRLNYAKPNVLRMMKKAGCVFINYGIESLDQKTLNITRKGLSVEMIYKGVEATLAVGISPGLNIIFGNIGETKKSLQKGVEFLLKYSDYSQMRTIRPVTPYPGSPLYYYALEKGLLKDCEDFYENKHVNSDLLAVNFTKMSDDEFHRALLKANSTLLKDYFQHYSTEVLKQAKKLYLEHDKTFRGFRTT